MAKMVQSVSIRSSLVLLLQVGLLLNIMAALRHNKDIGYVVATSSLYSAWCSVLVYTSGKNVVSLRMAVLKYEGAV